MSLENIPSTCIFGSYARSSSDGLSDRDVLVVGGEPHLRVEIARRWQKDGWSVAQYSSRRFEALTKSGSLFIHHLKNEGRIVEDRNGWLSSRLSKAHVKRSYEADARDSVKLAVPLERFQGEQRVERLPIVADVAFVAVRNFCICRLAVNKRLVFDYTRAVSEIAPIIDLTRREVDLLMGLREGKVGYRASASKVDIEGSIQDLKNVVSKMFPERRLLEVKPGVSVRNLGSGYATLRDFEAATVAQLGTNPHVEHSLPDELGRVWRWVRDPRGYSWEVRNFRAEVAPSSWNGAPTQR